MITTTAERPHLAASRVIAAAWCLVAAGVLPLLLPVAPNIAAQKSSAWHGLFVGMASVDHLLVVAGIAGVALSGALGLGRLSRAGTFLSIAGFGVLAVAEPTNDVSTSAAGVLYGLGSLGATLGLILTGVATIRTGRWRSWRRYTPLFSGLFFLVAVMPSFALPGRAFEYFIVLWGLTFLVLGIGMLAESSSQS